MQRVTREEKLRLLRANFRVNPEATIRAFRAMGLNDTEIVEQLAQVPKPSGETAETTSEMIILLGNQVKREHLKFMWEPYLPLGRLIHFGGAQNQGKSPVTIDLIARVTSASAWPDGQTATLAPRSVLLMNMEDSLEDAILPRFDLAGGDDSKLRYVHGTKLTRKDTTADVAFALDRDMLLLIDTAKKIEDLGLIVIDPITNYLGKLNMNREEEVRSVLTPLALLAREMNICVITVGHFNRRERGTDPLGRVMGAAAFTGVARAVYVFGPDPDASSPYSKIMSPARGSIGDDSLKYRTTIEKKTWDGETSGVLRVLWEGTTQANAEDVVDPATRSEKQGVAEAAKLLKDFLKAGRQPAPRCIQVLKEAGYDVEKLNASRIRKKAGADYEQKDKQFWWYLSTASQASKFEF